MMKLATVLVLLTASCTSSVSVITQVRHTPNGQLMVERCDIEASAVVIPVDVVAANCRKELVK